MNETAAGIWKNLQLHTQRMRNLSLRELFAADKERFQHFSRGMSGVLADFSKQRIDTQVLAELLKLADACDVAGWRERMFRGDAINLTENRAAWHVALRDPASDAAGQSRSRMQVLVEAVRSGRMRGYSGLPLRHVVNIGIGGSDLGPKLAHHALRAWHHPDIDVEFISHVDGVALEQLLKRLDPARTLFIITSKTFSTQETLLNARTARGWLAAAAGGRDIGSHFVAVTSAPAKAIEFGAHGANILEMHDWVGGRYSLWSAVGLSLALSIGWDKFAAFLSGAADMDRHFREAAPQDNLPILMALVGIWNVNFLEIASLAVLPYSESLRYLPEYLQQLEMESNGKSVDRAGAALAWSTNPLVWGGIGINGQHAYFQWMHQGTSDVACDFIAVTRPESNLGQEHQNVTLANCLAQSAALAFGRNAQELASRVTSPEQAQLVPHRVCRGNQPSTTLLLDTMNPHALGALLALYEHKVFVQGVIWGVNSFDQWGVELGKGLALNVMDALNGQDPPGLDVSTSGLSHHIRSLAVAIPAVSSAQPLPVPLSSQQAPESMVLATYNPQTLANVAARKDYNMVVLREAEKWIAVVKGSLERLVAECRAAPSVEKLGEGSALLLHREQLRKNEINTALARLQTVLAEKDKRIVQSLAQTGATELSLYRDARLHLDVQKAAITNQQSSQIEIRVKSGKQVRVVLAMHRNKKNNATPNS